MNCRCFIQSILALSISAVSLAQEIPSHTIVNLNDSAEMYHTLLNNAPIEPAFTMTPRFAIVGAQGRFIFTTGASVKFVMSEDWGNPVPNPTGMGLSDLTPSIKGNRQLFQMSAGGSGLYFNIIGFPNTENQVGLFLSINMDTDNNNSYHLAAGQIYMRYKGLQCGYATSLYNDTRADAYMIDGHGPCSSGSHSAVGINWQHLFGRHIAFGAGLEIPKVSFTQRYIENSMLDELGFNTHSYQDLPDIPLYIAYLYGSNSHVRLSGVLRPFHYINMVKAQSERSMGWGVKLTGKNHIGAFDLFYMLQFGSAIASYFNDNSNSGLDLIPYDDDSGLLRPTRSYGTIVGVQYNVSPRLFLTAQCSFMHNDVHRYSVSATTPYLSLMNHGHAMVTNCIWRISSLLNAGIEYRHIGRKNFSGKHLGNNRVYLMLLMNF